MSKVDKFWKWFTRVSVIGALLVSTFGAYTAIWGVGTSPPPPTSGQDSCESAWGQAYAWELVNSTIGNFMAMTAYLDCGPTDSYLSGSNGPITPAPPGFPGQDAFEAAQFCAAMESLNISFDQCMVTEGF